MLDLSIFKTELWMYISDIFIASTFIAFASVFFTEAVKISWEKIFKKEKLNVLFSWIINFIMIFILSAIFVLLKYKNFLLVGVFLFFLSWSFSINLYKMILKIFFIFVDIINIQTKKEKQLVFFEFLQAKLDVMKQEELILEKIKNEELKRIQNGS